MNKKMTKSHDPLIVMHDIVIPTTQIIFSIKNDANLNALKVFDFVLLLCTIGWFGKT